MSDSTRQTSPDAAASSYYYVLSLLVELAGSAYDQFSCAKRGADSAPPQPEPSDWPLSDNGACCQGRSDLDVKLRTEDRALPFGKPNRWKLLEDLLAVLSCCYTQSMAIVHSLALGHVSQNWSWGEGNESLCRTRSSTSNSISLQYIVNRREGTGLRSLKRLRF
jgi:hypothetical protein